MVKATFHLIAKPHIMLLSLLLIFHKNVTNSLGWAKNQTVFFKLTQQTLRCNSKSSFCLFNHKASKEQSVFMESIKVFKKPCTQIARKAV